MALRKRLNETVEELENLKKKHMELEVKFDTVNRELTIAKSDRELQIILLHNESSLKFYTYSDSCEQRPTRHPREPS